MKPANNGTPVPAEPVEPRTEPKGNPEGQSTRRTQDRESVSQAADRIRQFVHREPGVRLTTLLHHVTVDALRWAFFELKKDAAAGADGMTWRMYEEGLEGRLADLHDRVHSGAYRGTPQGSVISPILANVYLHYVLDLWFQKKWRNHEVKGNSLMVRYADDLVAGFQYERDAERFLHAVKERFGGFDLELHPDKTRLIEFGRFATERRRERGQGRPETFDFLGFTHYCAKTRRGRFQLGRKPVAKRMSRTLKRIKEALRRRMHDKAAETAKWLGKVVDGWLNYYAVPTSSRFLCRFLLRLKRLWLSILRRRSQKDHFTWASIARVTARHWPKLEIRHPWPDQRLAVSATGGATRGRSRMP